MATCLDDVVIATIHRLARQVGSGSSPHLWFRLALTDPSEGGSARRVLLFDVPSQAR